MFVQGLDCYIASRIEPIFAEFPWVLMGNESMLESYSMPFVVKAALI